MLADFKRDFFSLEANQSRRDCWKLETWTLTKATIYWVLVSVIIFRVSIANHWRVINLVHWLVTGWRSQKHNCYTLDCCGSELDPKKVCLLLWTWTKLRTKRDYKFLREQWAPNSKATRLVVCPPRRVALKNLFFDFGRRTQAAENLSKVLI